MKSPCTENPIVDTFNLELLVACFDDSSDSFWGLVLGPRLKLVVFLREKWCPLFYTGAIWTALDSWLNMFLLSRFRVPFHIEWDQTGRGWLFSLPALIAGNPTVDHHFPILSLEKVAILGGMLPIVQHPPNEIVGRVWKGTPWLVIEALHSCISQAKNASTRSQKVQRLALVGCHAEHPLPSNYSKFWDNNPSWGESSEVGFGK